MDWIDFQQKSLSNQFYVMGIALSDDGKLGFKPFGMLHPEAEVVVELPEGMNLRSWTHLVFEYHKGVEAKVQIY